MESNLPSARQPPEHERAPARVNKEPWPTILLPIRGDDFAAVIVVRHWCTVRVELAVEQRRQPGESSSLSSPREPRIDLLQSVIAPFLLCAVLSGGSGGRKRG